MNSEKFNIMYPIGTAVRYHSVIDLPEFVQSKTRSEAWELGCGETVVKIDGIAGGVSIRAIEIVQPHTNENKSKMYILLLDDPKIDLGHQILSSAHASLSGYLTFVEDELNKESDRDRFVALGSKTFTQLWAEESFRKVVCLVNSNQFNKTKEYGKNMVDYRIMVEMGLGGMETAIVVKPRNTSEDNSFNRFLKSLKLYK